MDASANLQEYLNRLNLFTNTLITEVNALHQTGFDLDGNTGWLFFDGTDASNIALHSDISDPRRIAASGVAGAPGNNGIAMALVNLRNQPLGALGGMTLPQYYNSPRRASWQRRAGLQKSRGIATINAGASPPDSRVGVGRLAGRRGGEPGEVSAQLPSGGKSN
jgi:hypothetical protein